MRALVYCNFLKELRLGGWDRHASACTTILRLHALLYYIAKFEKIILALANYSILCTLIHGGPYIQLWNNTYCTCKVFNTLHLNTWGSIYPTSKKYFLHVQSSQYFAPEYLGVHISNFEKILLTCANYSILCIYIPGGPYIQLRKILLARAKYSILCT